MSEKNHQQSALLYIEVSNQNSGLYQSQSCTLAIISFQKPVHYFHKDFCPYNLMITMDYEVTLYNNLALVCCNSE